MSAFERPAARAVVVVATLWFALVAAWELFGPILAGHYAASASVGIAAENMLHWDVVGPVWEYTATRPSPSRFYCHHPWGIFWTTAAFMKVLGRHDFVCRLPAVLLSAATPSLLYLLGRALWRPAAGAAAAAAFCVLPITLSFASFNALEVPVIAYTTLGLWGYVRFQQQPGRRAFLVASALGFALALHADWPAYVLVAVLLAIELARMIPPQRRSVRRARVLWWVVVAALALFTGLLYLWLFDRSDKLDDLFASYRLRSADRGRSLDAILAARRYWIALSFTPIAIALGKLGAVVALGRSFGRAQELVPLAVLAMAAFQYLAFPQGADVHVFWPHYFGQFFALAVGALTATALGALERRVGRGRAMALAGCILVVLLGAILRDGIEVLRYARATGGRFDERGRFIESDGAKVAFLRWLAPQLPAEGAVGIHAGMRPSWAYTWSLGGRVVRAPWPAAGSDRGPLLADARFLDSATKAHLAGRRVIAAGPFWAVFPGPGPLEAFAFHAREPDVATWYLVAGTEPAWSIAPDPFLTWELRHHFGAPATPPTTAPVGLTQLRIAHNLAIDRGDPREAARRLAAIASALGPPRAHLAEGVELVGARYEHGVAPRLLMVFRAGRPGDLVPHVHAFVEAGPALSTTMADPTVREVGAPMVIDPAHWREGFLYAHEVAIVKRPGTERFELSFHDRFGRPGGAPVVVLRLPRGAGMQAFRSIENFFAGARPAPNHFAGDRR